MLLGWRVARLLYLLFCLARWLWFTLTNDAFRAAGATLRYERVTSGQLKARPSRLVDRINQRIVQRSAASAGSACALWTSYSQSNEAAAYRREFLGYGLEYAVRLKYPRSSDSEDRQGDLIVLKPWRSETEKGVLLVEYNDAIRKLAALFDVGPLSRDYRLVLEPSTWGYQDPAIVMYLGIGTDVVVESRYGPDYRFMNELGGNICPISLGAGDWVDPNLFAGDVTDVKDYNLMMVASWLSLKRHETLFTALEANRDRRLRVALVGYPLGGRTAEDIKKEAADHHVLELVDFYESVPPASVSAVLRRSKVCVMLTKREGANRGIYEAFFSNVPVIVTESNRGINRNHVNGDTGMFSRDEDLPSTIAWMLDNYQSFTPRAWAIANTGCINATRRLNEGLRAIALMRGEAWTKDIYTKRNAPNTMYMRTSDRDEVSLNTIASTRFYEDEDRPDPGSLVTRASRSSPLARSDEYDVPIRQRCRSSTPCHRPASLTGTFR